MSELKLSCLATGCRVYHVTFPVEPLSLRSSFARPRIVKTEEASGDPFASSEIHGD